MRLQVVHNATPRIELAEEEVDRMLGINVKPLYFNARVCVPDWREKKRPGLLINLRSISALRLYAAHQRMQLVRYVRLAQGADSFR